MAISNQKLKFWAENEYNVIFSGKHGVGKTSIIEGLFNEMYGEQGKDWLSFSAATMDPWVDFIGVPKEKTDENGNTFLTLVRPEALAKDNVKAIFFDEFNRSPKKVRNAVMELMQFKSINGYKFSNLKLVWAAINPPDEDDDGMVYDVEKIDPAQLDRFHIFIDLPYSVSKPYFKKKYGPDNGVAACDWWNSLTVGLKNAISPRRLDYAMDIWSKGGDLKDIFPKNVPTTELMKQLNNGPYNERIKNILKGNMTDDEISAELADESLFKVLMEKILSGKEGVFEKLVPMLEDEKMLLILSKMSPNNIRNVLIRMGKNKRVYDVLKEAKNATGNGLTHAKKNSINEWMKSNYETDSTKSDNSRKAEKEGLDDIAVEDELQDLSEFLENIKSHWGINSSHERLKRFNELAAFLAQENAAKIFISQDKNIKNKFWIAFNKLLQKSNKPRVEDFLAANTTEKQIRIQKNMIAMLGDGDFAHKVIGYATYNPRMEILLDLLGVTVNDLSGNMSVADFIKEIQEK